MNRNKKFIHDWKIKKLQEKIESLEQDILWLEYERQTTANRRDKTTL